MSAAIALAVAGVAAAGASVYSANKQSKAAGKAADALGGDENYSRVKDALDADPEDLYGTRFTPAEYKSKVGKEGSYAQKQNDIALGNLGIEKDGLPGLFSLTNKINKRNLTAANNLTGNRFGAVLKNQGKDINSFLKGKVPDDVVDSINRLVSEHLGGAVNPSAIRGGFDFSATTADTARRLGITSLDLVSKGMSFAPAWQQTIQSFLYRPDQAAKDFLFPQISADIAAESLQKGIDENRYFSQNNILRAAAAPDPQARGKVNDALTLLALQQGADQSAAAAQAGLINSYSALGGSAINLGKAVAGYSTTKSGAAPSSNPFSMTVNSDPYSTGVVSTVG